MFACVEEHRGRSASGLRKREHPLLSNITDVTGGPPPSLADDGLDASAYDEALKAFQTSMSQDFTEAERALLDQMVNLIKVEDDTDAEADDWHPFTEIRQRLGILVDTLEEGRFNALVGKLTKHAEDNTLSWLELANDATDRRPTGLRPYAIGYHPLAPNRATKRRKMTEEDRDEFDGAEHLWAIKFVHRPAPVLQSAI